MAEKKLRVKDLSYNFMPSWFARNYGVKYGKPYFFDPEYRMKTEAEVKKLRIENLSSLMIHEEPPTQTPVRCDFGNATTGAFVGCEVEFPDDDSPRNKHLNEDRLDGLKLPDKIENVYPYKEMVSQTHYMNRKYKVNDLPIILPRGILNEAFLIEGDKILTDFYEDPDEAKRILDFSYGILERTVKYNVSIGYQGLVRILNCTVKLISPDMYEEWLLPYDLKIYELARSYGLTFGIHHCGDLTGRQMDNYRKIPEYAYLQVGFNSDLDKAVHLFPEAELHYIFDPVYCMQASKNEVEKKVEEILYQAGDAAEDVSIGVGAIDYGTPLENLQAIHDCLVD
jgi:uroporphyrinogen-III decarboxylase